MRQIPLLAAAAALISITQTVAAQTPFIVEARGGYTFPTNGDWNESGYYQNGSGAGLTVTAMLRSQSGVYVGWESFRFPADQERPGVDERSYSTDAGFRAGLASFIPLAALPAVTPFTELGLVYNAFEISVTDDPDTVRKIESDPSLGYEAGVGATIRMMSRLEVAPTFRYRQHKVEFENGRSETVGYFALGVGLRMRL
jgi:opacity protein-like surface antigen